MKEKPGILTVLATIALLAIITPLLTSMVSASAYLGDEAVTDEVPVRGSISSMKGRLPGNAPPASYEITTEWTRQFGTSSEEQASRVAVDSSGNIYIAGTTKGNLQDPVSIGGEDVYIRKYNSSGNVVWTRQFGTVRPESDFNVNGMTIDSSGNVYIAGEGEGAISGGVWSGGKDAWIRKYDSSGNVLVTSQFGTSGTDAAYGIAVDSTGTIYVVGYTSRTSAVSYLDCEFPNVKSTLHFVNF